MFSSLTKLEGTRVCYEDLDNYNVIYIYEKFKSYYLFR